MTKQHFQTDPDLLCRGTTFSLIAAVAHIKWKTKKYLQIWWYESVKIRMRCADSVSSRALFSYQPCSLSRLCRTICFCLSPSHTRTVHTDTHTHTDTHICQQLLWFSIWSTSAFTARDNTGFVCTHTHHLRPLKATRGKSASTLSLNCFIWSLTCLKMTLDKNIEATP